MPLSEVNTWDFDTIYEANVLLNMQNDFEAVYMQASMDDKKK